MSHGISFSDAVKKYNAWASNDAVTMTWSTSDLYAIADNKRAFLQENENINIFKYLDLLKVEKYISDFLTRLQSLWLKNQMPLRVLLPLCV